jgi:endoglucanase Acf2
MFITSVCCSTALCLHITTEKPLNKLTRNLALMSLTKKQLKHYNLVKNQTKIMPENLTGQDICTGTWEDNIKWGFRITGHNEMILCT